MNSTRVSTPEETAERLTRLAAALPGRGRVWIVTHDHPDPDALATAGAVHLLLKRRFGLRSQIVFSGMVARAENREMAWHFRYRLAGLESLRVPPRPVPAIFVDARPGSGNVTMPRWMKPVAVFDHHPVPRGWAPPAGAFVDIRPSIGACASLLHEYLAAAEAAVPSWLASCMVYAVGVETVDFTRGGSPVDREAVLALLPRASLRVLGEIKHAPLPPLYFTQLQEAIANARLYGRVAWSHLAEVPHPEIVPEIADRLVRIERISFSFCTGFHGDSLVVSVRGNRRDARCGSLIRAAVGGLGPSGGHDRMAAASIPVAGLDAAARDQLVERIHHALLKRMERRGRSNAAPGSLPARRLAPPADAAVAEPGAPDPGGQ
ncbi:MAG: hypothetical protein FJ221_13135 [Lentisphaerae bacterium]|nr:hypothetical protein [Lentisphaerota bacterium]